jgi:serine/threonine protein kinase
MDRYVRTKLLGKGSFASAWLVSEKDTHQKYVMKEMRVSSKQDLDDAIAESELHSRLEHQNIIQFDCSLVPLRAHALQVQGGDQRSSRHSHHCHGVC